MRRINSSPLLLMSLLFAAVSFMGAAAKQINPQPLRLKLLNLLPRSR